MQRASMNELPEHDISGLVDGALNTADSRRLAERLSQDRELQRQWTRYLLISDVLRANIPDVVDPDFADRVSRAVASEPAILAPRSRPRAIPPALRRVAGLAVAASVAAVAVLGVQSMYHDEGPTLVAEMPAAAEYVRIAQPEPVARPEVHPGLDKYLVNHHQHSASAPIQGAMPYARIVAYPGRPLGSDPQ